MTHEIKESVGKLGKNNVDDVLIVQQLLIQQGFSIGGADGLCGRRTIAGITSFQTKFLKYPDGLVEPAGKTLQRLNVIGFRPTKTNKVAPTVTSHQEIKKTMPTEVVDPLLILVKISDLGVINAGLSYVDNAYMINKLGKPRSDVKGKDGKWHLDFTHSYQGVSDDWFKTIVKTDSIGSFKVTGLRTAVESLKVIMNEISIQHPDVYTVLATDGMLNCRLMTGSETKISMHAWGIAIDLKLGVKQDKRGDKKALYGLSLIAPIFNKYGWCWGAGFPTEDSMHFEVGRDLLDTWLSDLCATKKK